jgi:nucleoside-diphosphate-sugar epimerase
MSTPNLPLLLVTGSAGLIGSRLSEALHDEFTIVGLDVKRPARLPAGAYFVECDLTDDASVRAAIARVAEAHGRRVASVVHLAAYYDFSGEPSPLYRELTVEGTGRLLRALRSLEVEQLVFSSSLLVMKPVGKDEPAIDEWSALRGEWDYPRSKIAAENLLRREHGSLAVVVLRMAGVYDEEGHSLPLGQQISRIYERKLESILFPGDKTLGQPFLHLDDLVECVRATIARRRGLGGFEVFLVAEPDVMSYEELQEQIGMLVHGREWPTIRIPKPVAKAGAWAMDKLPWVESFVKPWMIDLADQHYPVEIDRARAWLDWEPKHRLRDTLPWMIGRLEQDPKRWFEANGLPVPDEAREASRR